MERLWGGTTPSSRVSQRDLLIPGFIFLPFAVINRVNYVDDNAPYIPILAVIISLWSTVFYEKWKRRQNEATYLWDLTEFEHSQTVRVEYGGEYKIDGITQAIVKEDRISEGTRRWIVEIPLSIFGVGIIFAIFLGFQTLTDYATAEPEVEGEELSNPDLRTLVGY